MLTKLSLKGLALQCLFFNIIYAGNISAQNIKSVREAYVTLDLKNAGLLELFNSIESQTPYSFTFSREDIDQNFKVSKKGADLNVGDVLLNISKETGLIFGACFSCKNYWTI